MDIKAALARVVDNLDLSRAEMQSVMQAIMTGGCTDAQVGAFMVALRMKSESLDEIEGAASVMRERAYWLLSLARPAAQRAPGAIPRTRSGAPPPTAWERTLVPCPCAS